MKKPQQIQHEINLLIDDLENLQNKNLTRERVKILHKIQDLRQLQMYLQSGINEAEIKSQLNKLIEKRAFIKCEIYKTKNNIINQNKNPKIAVKKLSKDYNLDYIESQIKNLNYLLENENN